MTTLEIIAAVWFSGLPILALWAALQHREKSRRKRIDQLNADRREAHERACAQAIIEGRVQPPPPCTLTIGW